MRLIVPNWPAPAQIKAFSTTRIGGLSQPPYDSFNFSNSNGDNPEHVTHNRKLLQQNLGLPETPRWLKQVHGNHVVNAEEITPKTEADASYTNKKKQICAIMTADCLPILLCNKSGSQIAAIHGGWRSLAANIIEQTIKQFNSNEPLLAWLGPAINQNHFEVGQDVYDAFVDKDNTLTAAFSPKSNKKYLADIYAIAREQLKKQGIQLIFQFNYCTYRDKDLFFSYRRDGETGRMATFMWIDGFE